MHHVDVFLVLFCFVLFLFLLFVLFCFVFNKFNANPHSVPFGFRRTYNTPCSNSGVATGEQGGQSVTADNEKFAKGREKEGKIGKKEEKSRRKGKNREGSFTLPLLTDRDGYATVLKKEQYIFLKLNKYLK